MQRGLVREWEGEIVHNMEAALVTPIGADRELQPCSLRKGATGCPRYPLMSQ